MVNGSAVQQRTERRANGVAMDSLVRPRVRGSRPVVCPTMNLIRQQFDCHSGCANGAGRSRPNDRFQCVKKHANARATDLVVPLGPQQVSASAQQSTASTHQIADTSSQLADVASELNQRVAAFRV